jgi:rhodanese-related sulfurtransferase
MGIIRHLAVIAVLMATPAVAGEDDSPEVPAAAAGISVVNAAQVVDLIAHGAKVVDTRSSDDYFAGRIPGALHVGYTEYSARRDDFDPERDNSAKFLTRLHLFVDKSTPVILYCNGLLCWKSYKASRVVLHDDYKAIYWFRGGLAAWQAAGRDIERE